MTCGSTDGIVRSVSILADNLYIVNQFTTGYSALTGIAFYNNAVSPNLVLVAAPNVAI
jgi:hypothetical protein